jgi:hypothetical protein
MMRRTGGEVKSMFLLSARLRCPAHSMVLLGI